MKHPLRGVEEMWTLRDEFSNVEIGSSSHFRNLTLFPLIRHNGAIREPDYLLLEDAISQGKVRVTELHAGGSVPELRLENAANLPVLVVDGEELVGAKQNRVLNLTVLAPAKQTIVIPVSCVEAGRWSMATPQFRTADHVMYSAARAERVSQVTESMRSSGARVSDQGAVWRDIAAKAVRLNSVSPTGAMSAIYERHSNSVEELGRAFSWQQGQYGAAFAIGDQLVGLDIFDHPQVMNRFFPKLMRSYALDALDAASSNKVPIAKELETLFTQIGAAQMFSDPAVGLGKDIRFDGPEIAGAALWALERYVHICGFVKKRKSSGFWTRLSRPSDRGRF